MNDPCTSYELTFDPHPHYLRAHITAETVTRETALSYLQEIAHECERLNYRRILIERDVPVMLPDLELFQTTNDFFDRVEYVRIAVVNQYVSHQAAMRFAMLIGTNRGAKIKVFTTVWEAEEWLLEGVRVYSRGA